MGERQEARAPSWVERRLDRLYARIGSRVIWVAGGAALAIAVLTTVLEAVWLFLYMNTPIEDIAAPAAFSTAGRRTRLSGRVICWNRALSSRR